MGAKSGSGTGGVRDQHLGLVFGARWNEALNKKAHEKIRTACIIDSFAFFIKGVILM